MDALAQAMAAWSKVPSNVITSGFKAVQEQAIHFAKENAETSSAGCARDFSYGGGVVPAETRSVSISMAFLPRRAIAPPDPGRTRNALFIN
jgi:hypothetical protein